MTAGVTIYGSANVTSGASYDIRPGVGEEWIVHNVYVDSGKQIEIHMINGSVDLEVDTVTGSLLCFCFHMTRDYYMKVYNLSGDTIAIGYDGIGVV